MIRAADMAQKQASKHRAALKVGQRVVVRVGGQTIRGVLIEDRGTIGVGGRRLWRIRRDDGHNGEEAPREFEMPAIYLTPVASRARRVSRPTMRSFAR
jgi:hypothetical protein